MADLPHYTDTDRARFAAAPVPDDGQVHSVQLDPFPVLFGTDHDRIQWFIRHEGTPEGASGANAARAYPVLFAEARRISEREHQREQRQNEGEDRHAAAARRNEAAARAGREALMQAAAGVAARTARSEALRMDPAPHLSFDPGPSAPRSTGERRTADPDLTSTRRERDADRREEDVRAFIRRTAAAALSGREAPQPVEIVRPRHTRAETVSIVIGAAVNLALGIAAVRYAARTLLGVDLTRWQAFVVIFAGQSASRGSGSSFWTRSPRTTR